MPVNPSEEFLIGVWAQPSFQFTGPQQNVRDDRVGPWVDLGVRHFFSATPEPKTQSNTRESYAKWVRDRGAVPWLYASADLQADLKLDLGGFLQPDEPDMDSHLLKGKSGAVDVDLTILTYLANYQRIKAAAPDHPVLGNFAGPRFTSTTKNSPVLNLAGYKRFFGGVDLPSADWYLPNTGRNVQKYVRYTVARQHQYFALLAPGKPSLACVESSFQNLVGGRCPTPAEFELIVSQAVMNGARGIWYFPQRVVGASPNATPPEIAERMRDVNARLARYAPFFLKGDRKLTVDDGGPFDACTWTATDGRTLTITTNTFEAAQVGPGGRLYQSYESVWSEAAAPTPMTVDQRFAALETDVAMIKSKLGI